MKALMIACVLSVGLAGSGWAGDAVALTAVPAPVMDTLAAYFPGSTPISAEVEQDDGVVKYEVKLQYKEIVLEAEVTSQGRIVDLDM